MKAVTIIIILFLFVAFIKNVIGQHASQTIRGVVVDQDSRSPLFGASLVIEGSDPQIGSSTDIDGMFQFEKLPVGRYTILVYYVGYETRALPNLALTSGKELVLEIDLVESVINLEEIVIKAKKNKSETLNEMSTVSARSFTVEETRRYAGSVNDPARMASAFAGVASDPGGNNEIIVRGNSPRGMLWRLEGVEVPNPNHFAEEGSTGGPISILNGTTLDNSDFFTGAFPSEYGNAYSGVFDIGIRNGNNQQREYTLQAGFLGLDCTLEGPFSKQHQASYLVNYRYSTLAMLNKLGVHIAGDAVPEFQDATFKINVPTEKAGSFSLFGLGGSSTILEEGDDYRNDFNTDMLATGINHTYFFNEKTYLKSYIAYTGSRNIWSYQEPDSLSVFYLDGRENFIYQTLKGSINLHRKFDARNFVKTGVIISRMDYDLFTDFYDRELNSLITEVDQSGRTTKLQSYISWKHRINDHITLISGVHSMAFALNGNITFEPRIGVRWEFAPRQTLTGGFGVHSRIESLSTYFAEVEQGDGSFAQTNRDLDFTKARHYIIGYENLLADNLFLKLEVYYQQLYSVPIEDMDTSSFSALNYSWGYTTRQLVNEGTGRNMGMEFTLEKYFDHNYYFLFTSSLYDSKYKAADQVVRDTRYNGNYVLNLLAGKDFMLGKKGKERTLSVSFRGSMAGGQRSTPIDLHVSAEKGYTVRNDDLAFSEQWSDYMRYDLKISLIRNRPKTTHTIELDIQNFTNRLNVIGNYYEPETGEIDTYTQMGMIPVFNYRVEF